MLKFNVQRVGVVISWHSFPSSLPTTFAFGEILSGPQDRSKTSAVQTCGRIVSWVSKGVLIR